jgi:hypothetical protein
MAFSAFVLSGIIFCAAVVAIITAAGEMAVYNSVIIFILIFLSLWAHVRTMLGDPGAVPATAHPLLENVEVSQIVCGRCECYKPPMSHHGTYCRFPQISLPTNHLLWLLPCRPCFQEMYIANGPLLSLDEQCNRGQEPKEFLSIPHIHRHRRGLCLYCVGSPFGTDKSKQLFVLSR